MFFRRLFSPSVAMAGLMAAAAMAQTGTTTTRTANLPPIGLGSTETAQINVANLAAASSSGTAASCTGTIAFVNSSGATIGTASSFTIPSGQVFSVSLPFSRSGGSGVHTVIRGVVTVTPASGVPCELESSLEVYDTTTGVTHSSANNGLGEPGFGR